MRRCRPLEMRDVRQRLCIEIQVAGLGRAGGGSRPGGWAGRSGTGASRGSACSRPAAAAARQVGIDRRARASRTEWFRRFRASKQGFQGAGGSKGAGGERRKFQLSGAAAARRLATPAAALGATSPSPWAASAGQPSGRRWRGGRLRSGNNSGGFGGGGGGGGLGGGGGGGGYSGGGGGGASGGGGGGGGSYIAPARYSARNDSRA